MTMHLLARERARIAGTRVPPGADRRPPLPDPQARDAPGKVPSDVRWEKVRALRRALFRGEYDVDARLSDLLDHWPTNLRADSMSS